MAYAHAPEAGEVFLFHTPPGHADHLDDGIIYPPISDTIAACIRYLLGSARGAGLLQAVDRFHPYRTCWQWVEHARVSG